MPTHESNLPPIPDEIPEEGQQAIRRTLAWPQFRRRRLELMQAEYTLCLEAEKLGLEDYFDAGDLLERIVEEQRALAESEASAADLRNMLREVLPI